MKLVCTIITTNSTSVYSDGDAGAGVEENEVPSVSWDPTHVIAHADKIVKVEE